MTPKELLQKPISEIEEIVNNANSKSPFYILQLKEAIENNNPLSIAFMGDDICKIYKLLK